MRIRLYQRHHVVYQVRVLFSAVSDNYKHYFMRYFNNQCVSATDKQETHWVVADAEQCPQTCGGDHAHCMCGTKVGVYGCVCEPGYQFIDAVCVREYSRHLMKSTCFDRIKH